jgi:hypothetical protein
LVEDAAQLRSLEGAEKQAAENQTVSGAAAKELGLSLIRSLKPTASLVKGFPQPAKTTPSRN